MQVFLCVSNSGPCNKDCSVRLPFALLSDTASTMPAHCPMYGQLVRDPPERGNKNTLGWNVVAACGIVPQDVKLPKASCAFDGMHAGDRKQHEI